MRSLEKFIEEMTLRNSNMIVDRPYGEGGLGNKVKGNYSGDIFSSLVLMRKCSCAHEDSRRKADLILVGRSRGFRQRDWERDGVDVEAYETISERREMM